MEVRSQQTFYDYGSTGFRGRLQIPETVQTKCGCWIFAEASLICVDERILSSRTFNWGSDVCMCCINEDSPSTQIEEEVHKNHLWMIAIDWAWPVLIPFGFLSKWKTENTQKNLYFYFAFMHQKMGYNGVSIKALFYCIQVHVVLYPCTSTHYEDISFYCDVTSANNAGYQNMYHTCILQERLYIATSWWLRSSPHMYNAPTNKSLRSVVLIFP